MKKRITAFMLAVILGITAVPETVCAFGEENMQQAEPGEETEELQEVQEEQEAEKIYYTISFDTAGGTLVESLQTAAGELPDAAAVGVTERKGYLFRGWLEETGAYYDFSQPITEDMVLTAEWMPITYKVRFSGNGGTGTMQEQVLTYDREEPLKQNSFTKEGYVFEGWKTEQAGDYGDQAVVKNLADTQDAVVTLKAIWRQGTYKVRFDANGGSGTMKEEAFTYGKTRALYKNDYKRSGYSFKGWNTRRDGKGTFYSDKQKVKSLSSHDGSVVNLYAVWEGVPYQIRYDRNGADSGKMSVSSHVCGIRKKLTSNKYKRKGYTFAGWNTRADGKGTAYKNTAEVSGLAVRQNETITLYAKWKPIKYKITYVTKGGKMPKSYRKDYTVAAKTFTLVRPARKGYDFDGWYKDSKYKHRIGEVKKGRTGNLKIYAKWVKCTGKIKTDAAKITTCVVTRNKNVAVGVSVKKRVASSDDYYYLVYLNPVSKKPYKMAARTYKKKNPKFYLKVSKNRGYVNGIYGIAVKKNGKYYRISNSAYVKNIQNAAGNRSSYKPGATKKGMQFYNNMEEIKNCGAKNNFLNVTASYVLGNPTVPYEYNGKTYYFNSMQQYQEIVKECNRKKINVTMQILLDWSDTDLIAAKARVPGKLYYTWNVSGNAAREKMEAMFSYLGMVFGKKNCYTSNWILGNEVNNPAGWHYKGSMSDSEYFRAYAHAFRALYYAVRSQYSNAKVFICVDNRWNTAPAGGYGGKQVITSFVREVNKIQKGLKWNLAYHAYSAPLTDTLFWRGWGTTDNENSPYITMKNLQVLTNYIKRNYGSSTRIILSEQGYSSNPGQQYQAAALAYSYYLAACNPMVDSFIIRSYWDHPVEVAQGISMGIAGKEAFQVYKYMDTSKSEKYTKKYLKVIGAKSWKKLVPGYSKSRIRKMYRKT